MKKQILFIVTFCLTSTILLASGPDKPVLTLATTECQSMMMPITDESVQITQEYEVIRLVQSNNGCSQYATESAQAEIAHYGGDMWDFLEAIVYYADACDEAGGADYMLDPVFL